MIFYVLTSIIKTMDSYLMPNVLSVIYSYLSYSDLRRHRNVPDDVWHSMYEYFCTDNKYQGRSKEYWGPIITVSYKIRILDFIDFVTKIPDGDWPIDILLKNKDFVREGVERGYCTANTKLDDDYDLVLKAVKWWPYVLRKSIYKANAEFVQKAIKINTGALIYMDSSLKHDNKIMIEAARCLGISTNYDTSEMYRRCIVSLVTQNPSYYDRLDSETKQLDEVYDASRKAYDERQRLEIQQRMYNQLYNGMMTREGALALIENGMELRYLRYNKFVNDIDFMKRAFEISPYYRKSVAVKHGIWNGYRPVYFLRNDLKRNKDFVLELLMNEEYEPALRFHHSIDLDPDLNFILIRQHNIRRVVDFKPGLCQDRNFIRKVLAYDRTIFGYIPNEFKNNVEWVEGVRDLFKGYKGV